MPAPLTPDELQQTLGRLSSGVYVITAVQGTERRGLTVQTVTAVSHQPPLLAVTIPRSDPLHDLLTQESLTHFGVNVLSSQQKDLAAHFSGKTNVAPAISWFDHEGLPLLGGTIAQIVCRKEQAILLGDHTLFTGHILYSRFTDDDPLLSFRGQYHELG